MSIRYYLPVTLLLAVSGCGSDDKSDAQFKAEIVTGMHQLMLTQIQGLNQAARDLQKAAPSPIGRGWDETLDAAQVTAMKEAWDRTRLYWEQAEGTLADFFPDLDETMDSRYEDILMSPQLVATPDTNLFDGEGVTGMHAIERILFAPTTPRGVVDYESTLTGYQAAAWPASEAEAADFHTGLCQRLVSDTQSLLDMWKSKSIDLCTVFQGTTKLMTEQAEKLGLAVEKQQESRYSQKTMADLRFNLMGTAGTIADKGTGGIFGLFRPWLATKAYGATLDSLATTAFTGIATTYGTVVGDEIPPPPASWNSIMPTPEDLQSTFGILYETVLQEVDPNRSGSAVESLNQVGKALGLSAQTCPN